MKILSWAHQWGMFWRLFLAFGAMIYLTSLAQSWGNEMNLFCDGLRHCHRSGEVQSWFSFVVGHFVLVLFTGFVVALVMRQQRKYWNLQLSAGFDLVEDVPKK